MVHLILDNSLYRVFPSILSADFTRLGDEIDSLMSLGIDTIHIDIMDNHYVPNLTFGPLICEALNKRYPALQMDVHIMASPVDGLIQACADAGATQISIHPDASIHLDRSLQLIRNLGCKAGLVLNPATSPNHLDWCMHHLDFVLIMTVNPGFGGQSLIPYMIQKIVQVHKLYPKLPIVVDGGINTTNIASLAQAGASAFVVGSALFNTPDYAKTLLSLRTAF
jgi:ribulose-phosphate 3-epimerase